MNALTPKQVAKRSDWQAALDTMLPYFGDKIPELGNLTPQGMIDFLGSVKELIKDAEKVENILKERLKPQLEGRRQLEGDVFKMDISTSTRNALNQAKSKEVLDSIGRLAECMSETAVETMRISRR